MEHRKSSQSGFTLMELMVVIVIVAILAAVAVPLYINYVKDAQRTEAKGAIAAIITAEQVRLQKDGEYLNYENATFLVDPSTLDAEARLDVDVSEAIKNGWVINVTGADDRGFVVTAIKEAQDLEVVYTHNRDGSDEDPWTDK